VLDTVQGPARGGQLRRSVHDPTAPTACLVA
jgi:hypothetical protein